LYPVTRAYGPIVACNVLHLIAPPLAGWSAFVLCRYIAGRWWPAWLGGWLFAFSPYMLTGMADQVFLMLVFPVPLVAWVTLRRLAGTLSANSFVTILVPLLVAQFLISPEIFASTAVFCLIAFCLAARLSCAGEHANLRSAAGLIVIACAVSALILSPYLYRMFTVERPSEFIFSPWRTSIDLVNFLIPTTTNEFGNIRAFRSITHHFLGTLYDSGGYIGLPLIAIVALSARERWHERDCRLVVCMFVFACILAMGPFLEIVGYRVIPLPGAALAAIPLIDKALPGRFMMYAYLAAAVLVALCLAEERGRQTFRWALGLAIVPFMLPNLSTSFWNTPAEVPAFFTSGLYRQYLASGQTVMVLPYGFFGEGMLWQAVTEMYFRMAGGFLSAAPLMPTEHSGWPIMAGLYHVAGVPDAGDQLKAYLANHDVSAVIVGPRTQYLVARMGNQRVIDTWLLWPTIDRERIATDKLLASLNTQPLEVGGVTLYRIAPQTLVPYRNLTALEMQRRMARARFEALLLGAQRYLAQGGDPASLSPERAQELGLLPQDWFGGAVFTATNANPHYFHFKVVLGPSPGGLIAVGIEGGYDALEPLIGKYEADASRIYFPYPVAFSPASAPREAAMMVMTFDRAGLERAVATARRDAACSHATQPAHGDRRVAGGDR